MKIKVRFFLIVYTRFIDIYNKIYKRRKISVRNTRFKSEKPGLQNQFFNILAYLNLDFVVYRRGILIVLLVVVKRFNPAVKILFTFSASNHCKCTMLSPGG